MDDEEQDPVARIHVDLPRITVDQMSTSQASDPAADPTSGCDVDTDFMMRRGAW